MTTFTKYQLKLLDELVTLAIKVKEEKVKSLGLFQFIGKETHKRNILYLKETLGELKSGYAQRDSEYEFSTDSTRALSAMALDYYKSITESLAEQPELRSALEAIIEKTFSGETDKRNGLDEHFCELSGGFMHLDDVQMGTTNDEIETMRKAGFTHMGIITRVGSEPTNPFESDYPKAYISFDEDFRRVLVRYDNQDITARYSFHSQDENMTTYGEGSVRYMETSGQPFLYMDAGVGIEIAISLARMLDGVEQDTYMQRLFDWADYNKIDELQWNEAEQHKEGGYFFGFPRDKDELLALKELDIALFKIKELPVELGELYGLNELYAQGNEIEDFPKELCRLTGLRELQLQKNKLTYLPEEFGDLIDLTVLDLKENRLVRLPKGIGDLRSLISLSLSDNKLGFLPHEIGRLQELKGLYLQDNNIERFQEEVCSLRNLSQLGLSNNAIAELPKEIGNLNSLTQISLDGNQLSYLPDEIGHLTGLENLILANNKLSALPEAITNLTNLQNLDLTENPLVLSFAQRIWVEDLIRAGSSVYVDDGVWVPVGSPSSIDQALG